MSRCTECGADLRKPARAGGGVSPVVRILVVLLAALAVLVLPPLLCGHHSNHQLHPLASHASPSPARRSSVPRPAASPAARPSQAATSVADEDYSAIDAHALAAPADVENDPDRLAAWLVQPARTDGQRARALFRWEADRIHYDLPAFQTDNIPDQSPQAVLASRKAVCAGYSRLYERLAHAAGLECEIVPGFSRGVGWKPGDPYPDKDNHAWNAVRIAGEWRLLDVTWGSGYIDMNRNEAVSQFDDFYFLTPPSEFIYAHLPHDDKWQLLSPPLSRDEHERLAVMSPQAFRWGLTPDATQGPVIHASGAFDLDIGGRAAMAMSAVLYSGHDPLGAGNTFCQRENGRWHVRVAPPAAGTYTLHLFVGEPGARQLGEALSYRVEASEAAAGKGFPIVYQAFHERAAELEWPFKGRLDANTMQHFAITVPGATSVQVLNGDEWHKLTRDGDRFTGDELLKEGKTVILVESAQQDDPSRKHYDSLLEYRAE
jgi:hypothetical protein